MAVAGDFAMHWLDVSPLLRPGMPIYPGDPPITVEPFLQRATGDQVNIAQINMGSHSGCHVDAPRHLWDEGATVDQLDWQVLIGPALVVEISQCPQITRQHLEQMNLKGVQRLLFKTDNSGLWSYDEFYPAYVTLEQGAAAYLVEQGIRLVGWDYLSIDPDTGSLPAHQILLSREVVVVEGLHLAAVTPGNYFLVCCPLPLQGGDGAPARVILGCESA